MPPETEKLTLHRARFVDWTPAAITAVAPTPDGLAVAVGREDGGVELYNVQEDWQCVLRVPGTDGFVLTSLVWCSASTGLDADDAAAAKDLRLVAAGLGGNLVEIDLLRLRPRSSTSSMGGPVWHMSAQPPLPGSQQLLAVGCDDGCLRLFGIRSKGLSYVRSFPRVDARILSTAWHGNRHTVVTGSSDGCVRCWDTQTMGELLRITVGRDLQVWSVLVLQDGTLVSGDSAGSARFWDGAHGTQTQAFRTHDADVLALAALPCGTAVFAAGVDAKVVQMQRVDARGGGGAAGGGGLGFGDALMPDAAEQWAVTGTKRPHTHDIRALAVAPFPRSADTPEGAPDTHVLLSGGTDTQLLAYSAELFDKEHPVRVVRLPPVPAGGLALRGGGGAAAAAAAGEEAHGSPAHFLHVGGRNTLDVWRLGVPRADARSKDPLARLAAGPRHVARITVPGAQRALCAAALSRCGTLAACSDGVASWLFRLDLNDKKPSVRSAKLAGNVPGATHMAFTGEGGASALALVSADGTVYLADTATGAVRRKLADHLTKSEGKAAADIAAEHSAAVQLPPVSAFAASLDGRFVAVATFCDPWGLFAGAARKSHVRVYDSAEGKPVGSLALPSSDGAEHPITALGFSSDGRSLVAASAGSSVHVASAAAAKDGGGWRWEGNQANESAAGLKALSGHIVGLSVDPKRGLAGVVAHSLQGLAVMDLAHNGYNAVHASGEDAAADGDGARAAKRVRRPKPSSAASSAARPGRLPIEGGVGYVQALEHPCIFAGHLGGDEAVMVERPAQDMLRALPLPLDRHRFGT